MLAEQSFLIQHQVRLLLHLTVIFLGSLEPPEQWQSSASVLLRAEFLLLQPIIVVWPTRNWIYERCDMRVALKGDHKRNNRTKRKIIEEEQNNKNTLFFIIPCRI